MTANRAEYITWAGAFEKALAYGLTHAEGVQYADSTVRMIFGPNPSSEAQLRGMCHWCELNDAASAAIVNPYNGKMLPTCPVCEYDFLLETDRLRKAKPMRLAGWVSLIAGIIVAIVSSAAVGIPLAAVGVALLIACGKLWSRDERDEKLHAYAQQHGLQGHPLVSPKKLRWCKTCVHHRHQGHWSDPMKGLWHSEGCVPAEQLPCGVAQRAAASWQRFFATQPDDRTCYPRTCEQFAPQIGAA